jgi:lysozyme
MTTRESEGVISAGGRTRRGQASSAIVLCLVAVACGSETSPYGSSEDALCPGGTVLEGVDVSVYQGSIDWSQVKSSGHPFAIARISDGSYLDTTFAQNWSGMKAAGLVRGSYQFFEPGEDPVTQADIVIQKVGVLGTGDLPVVADMEVTGGLSGATIAANLQTWIDHVKAGTGKTPMIYTSPGFWNGKVGSSAFGGIPLWVANWGVSCPGLPSGWNAFKIWQYSDAGHVAGIPATVDLDRFNGTLADLEAFSGAVPAYAAKFVSQSWPFAVNSFPIDSGELIHASIVLKNVGSASWDSHTKLATTEPRDRVSPFANGTWLSSNRLAAVSGTVPPGGTFEFKFDWQGPAKLGTYDEFYGVVQEGTAWFSAPNQGGPPDHQLEAKIDVHAAPYVDAGTPKDVDAGPTIKVDSGPTADFDSGPTTEVDAGPTMDFDSGPMIEVDSGIDPVDAGDVDAGGIPSTEAKPAKGCGCGSTADAPMMLGSLMLLVYRRRRTVAGR